MLTDLPEETFNRLIKKYGMGERSRCPILSDFSLAQQNEFVEHLKIPLIRTPSPL